MFQTACRRFTNASSAGGVRTRPFADSESVVGIRRRGRSGTWVFRTATILRLEYAKLKRMTKSVAPVKRRTASPAEFLELVAPPMAPPPGSGLSECVIELEGPRGKMRVQWKGVTPPDLAGLSRSLWESA